MFFRREFAEVFLIGEEVLSDVVLFLRLVTKSILIPPIIGFLGKQLCQGVPGTVA